MHLLHSRSRFVCRYACLSIHTSVHSFFRNRGSSGLQMWICYEVGCIDGKIGFWSREAGETAGSKDECVLIRDLGRLML